MIDTNHGTGENGKRIGFLNFSYGAEQANEKRTRWVFGAGTGTLEIAIKWKGETWNGLRV